MSTAANQDEQPAGPAPATIDVDPAIQQEEESDADTQSINTTSTASLSESVLEYRRIHGRTYTQKTDYYGPNDEKQNEGLDLFHYWVTVLLDDKLCLAPVGEKAERVLDVGTGTGLWACDFADEFPATEVIGVDISPIQPSWAPPNCKFQIDDIDQPWTWPDNHFDYIHARNLEGCISDWALFDREAFNALKPGGFFEVAHLEFHAKSQNQTLPEDHVFNRWATYIFDAFNKLGKTAEQHRNDGIVKNMEQAGFVDIQTSKWKIPIGAWPRDPKWKEIGDSYLTGVDQSLEGYATFLLKEMMGWEYAEILVFVSEMRKELRNDKIQPIIQFQISYGRKPEDAPVAE
ncbi:Secondary metabolism regulator LAE1 [Colletotrichum sidae]|uniref:Secondary metabolism regulator LAE1 n=1 Tax=Colletotrichum sidae TaxID=1347389 RepID=A0A4R8TG57_9PEZI|nr:Secondary metabolism regulator LAE1 [Colletotrichum sidae]